MVNVILGNWLPWWCPFPYAWVPLGLAFVSFGMVVWRYLRLRRLRRRHVMANSPLSDEEFIKALGMAGADSEGARRVRHAIARVMRVPSDTVYPSDELGHIARFGFDGLDIMDLAFQINRALEIEIPDSAWKKFFKGDAHDDVADLIRFLAEEHFLASDQAASPPA
jgi:acyl carrier protein